MRLLWFIALTLSASSAFAQISTSAGRDIVPLLAGRAAPYSGLLVPEARYVEFVEAEINLEASEQRLAAQIRFTNSLESMYRGRLEDATKPLAWYKAPSFNRWVGFGIGIIVTGVVVWGGVEIVKATGNGN